MGRVAGTLVRYCQNSYQVLADYGCRWTVHPGFLRPVEPRDIKPEMDAGSRLLE
jgi:hypothetical protein